jgi:hypothetical protein
MTITVRWLIENRVMLSDFIGEVDSEQVLEYLEKSFAMRDQANAANGEYGYLVHTITDATRVTKQNVDLVTAQKIMTSLREQRIGWSLFVSPNRLHRFISGMSHQFGGIRFQAFETLDEAIAFLKENDAALADALNALD